MKKTIAITVISIMLVFGMVPAQAVYAQVVAPDYSAWTQEQRDAKLLELLTLVIQLLQQLQQLQAQMAAQLPVAQPAPSEPAPAPQAAPSAPVAPILAVQVVGPTEYQTGVIGGNCQNVVIEATLSGAGKIAVINPETKVWTIQEAPLRFVYVPQATSTTETVRFMASSTSDVSINIPLRLSSYEELRRRGHAPSEAADILQRAGVAVDMATGKCR